MAIKFIVLCGLVAVAQAGFLAAPTITSENQNVIRSYGNLGQVSTFSKTIDTPYSSVSKHDVRVSNPGIAYAAAPAYAAHGYAAPAYAAHGYAAPAYAAPAYAAPAYAAHGYAAPAYAAPAYAAHGYAAPVAKIAAPLAYAAPAYHAPAVVAKVAAPAYAAPAYAAHGYAAPAYAAPAYAAHGYAAPAVAKVAAVPALLGVAYSAAPAVSHMTYSNGVGLAYSW